MIRSEIDYRVKKLNKKTDSRELNEFINEFKPFIVSQASNVLKRYVYIENDEGYENALIAFYDAIVSYDFDKGSFIAYSKKIIHNRLINYLKKENNNMVVSLENEDLEGISDKSQEQKELKTEIEEFETELCKYGLTVEILEEKSPKHKDTRDFAKELAIKIKDDQEIIPLFNEKRKLPITKISRKYGISRKVLYKSKEYITSIVIILNKNFICLKNWI
ncbi:MAG TPA: sigma factor [Anaerovoracaceae bacterium]|nr:sigma factor [Anaerovoracaceae bacterium]